MGLRQRRKEIEKLDGIKAEEFISTVPPDNLLEIIDNSIESAIGAIPVPLGVASGFLIDNELYNIPMATEEPSVVAAATFAGRRIARWGGFVTQPAQPVMAVQVFMERAKSGAENIVLNYRETIRSESNRLFPKMVTRGGGFLDLDVKRLERTGLLKITIFMDVRDAFGANILNTVGEAFAPLLEKLCEGKSFMKILTNNSDKRVAKASFSFPVEELARAGLMGQVVAEKIVLASDLASEDPERAVTHNKGIMNGISALALATGNDTRALESAAHLYAVRDGEYKNLSRFFLDERGRLAGEIEIPTPLGTHGGNISFNPASRFSLSLLRNPDAKKLSGIAASLGLAQNFAAIWALVTEGIQRGHMHLHGKRLAYQVGARGQDIEMLAARLSDSGKIDLTSAQLILEKMKQE
jgi:hydroxymethylglutaryl-CoA reductase